MAAQHGVIVSNPILHGMYPDPSWIWDGERQEIVLVNSTFELVPGLPIHVSTDMAHWTHASDAINADMARRLLIPFVDDSGGVYAPTLRNIGGKYVIACTIARINQEMALSGGCTQAELDAALAAEGNFIIEADSLEGPWRGPFWITGAEGIDPDIFEDSDGTVYWTQTRPAVDSQWEGQTEVWTQRIDPDGWRLINDGGVAGAGKSVIWKGYGVEAVWAEAPHLYRIGDYVYLMTAEGGTSFEHSEMAMRTYAPNGLRAAVEAFDKALNESGDVITPARENERCYVGVYRRLFHADKKNPILTHRHLGLADPIQCVGHFDMLHHPTLGWWIVTLGVRETVGAQPGELLSYLGRESFVAPLTWEHNPANWKLDGTGVPITPQGDPGWPVVAAGLGRLPETIDIVNNGDGNAAITLHAPSADAAEGTTMTVLDMTIDSLEDDSLVAVRGNRSVLYRRISEDNTLMPMPQCGMLRVQQNSTNYVTLYMSENSVNRLTVNAGERSQAMLPFEKTADGLTVAVLFHDNRLMIMQCAKTALSEAKGDGLTPGELLEDPDTTVLEELDARFMSTEWSGGFVGCMAGSVYDGEGC